MLTKNTPPKLLFFGVQSNADIQDVRIPEAEREDAVVEGESVGLRRA